MDRALRRKATHPDNTEILRLGSWDLPLKALGVTSLYSASSAFSRVSSFPTSRSFRPSTALPRMSNLSQF